MRRIQLDNFIKDSTHELNTPITALILSVNSPMLHSPKNLERIRLSASRISQIHKDLIYLLLEEKSSFSNHIPLLINKVVDEQLSYLSLLANKRGISIKLSTQDNIYFAISKEDFSRLFSNLISNAIKYNKKDGKVDIIITKNLITIKDTGIGIAKESQKEIYQRFYRVSNSVGGFGLGLNIVNKICKAYNINITMKSTLGEGSSFELKFPDSST